MNKNMRDQENIIKNLIFLWKFLKSKRKKQLFLLFFILNISGIVEIFTLASIIPFINIITNPDQITNIEFFSSNGFTSNKLYIVIPVTFGLLALTSSIIRISNLWINGRLSAAIGSDISISCFRKTISQNYQFHINKNSNEVLNTLAIEVSRIPALINSVLTLISSFILLIFIVISLFFFSWIYTLSAFVFIGSIYIYILLFCKNRLFRNSKLIAKFNDTQIKQIQESLGAIKEIILNKNYDYYLKSYLKNDIPLRRLQVQNKFLALVPRFGVEGLVLFGIAIFVLISTLISSDLNSTLPVLGLLAFAGQRLLPIAQLIFTSISQIQSQKTNLMKVVKCLRLKSKNKNLLKEKLATLRNNIIFEKVYFKYTKDDSEIISNFSFKIKKGEKIGLIGSTGSGKSTLVDLLMGLLTPTKGKIIIDDVVINDKNNIKNLNYWHQSIAHVPQNFFFANSTIEENIAFGIPKNDINHELVIEVAKQAKISKFIESKPHGYNSYVGERGISLSGGQLQRIGIARALYRNTKVLIFDEITSSLDSKTEAGIISSINSLRKDLTIIMIAHRKEILKDFDKVIEIDNGKIKKIYNKSELINF